MYIKHHQVTSIRCSLVRWETGLCQQIYIVEYSSVNRGLHTLVKKKKKKKKKKKDEEEEEEEEEKKKSKI